MMNDQRPSLTQLGDLLRARARRWPQRIAARAEESACLDYATLDERSEGLARRLRARGIGPEIAVGLCAERGLESLVGMFAIWKAGGVYVPLDPALPRLRLDTIVDDARVAHVLVDRRNESRFSTNTVRLEGVLEGDGAGENPSTGSGEVSEDHAAYVIYTSGSTGRPKGVVVEHRSLLGLALAQTDLYDADEHSHVLQLASCGFDVSLAELALALGAGGTLHLADSASLAPGTPLAAVLRERAITHLMITPSALRSLGDVDLPALRVLITGGEPCGLELIERWSRPGRRLFNVYGATEATVSSTAFESTGVTTAPPIGQPHAGAVIRILDPRGEPVAIGHEGEIAVGGPGVARGYVGDPALTAARFIPDPQGAQGERLYRTGDLGRWRPDGNLEFLGRVDEQLKVRGVRIEPGEIEAALRTCTGVRDAVAGTRTDAVGDSRLVAWVVAGEAAPSKWREELRRLLPESMLPSAFVVLPQFPRMLSGKVERNALPTPPRARPPLATSFAEPVEELEQSIAAMIAEDLQLDRVGLDDDLFDLGGNSLHAARLQARLRVAFRVEVSWTEFLAKPTVRALSTAVASERGSVLPVVPPAPVPRTGPLPLSPAQQRLVFLHQLAPSSLAYGLPAAVRIRGPVCVRTLERALGELERRHDALRTTFPSVDGVPRQHIAEPAGVSLAVEDLCDVPATTRTERLRERVRAALAEPFDVEQGPLWRPCLYRLEAEEHVLALTMHHLVADGWSIGVLVREMASLYGGIDLAPPELQPVDVAAWDARRWSPAQTEEQLAFWRSELADAPPRTPLPTDRPRPPVPSHRGARRALAISKSTADRVRSLAREVGATPFMVLLTGFAGLLGLRRGLSEVVLGTPVANRGRPELDGVVGFLANTLALRVRLDRSARFRDLVALTRQTVTDAWRHQDLPFERVVAELEPERDTSHPPIFQVLFALQQAPAQADGGGVRFRLDDVDAGVAPFDLTVQLWEDPEGFGGSILYATDLFDGATVDRLAEDYQALLQRAVDEPDEPISSAEAPRPSASTPLFDDAAVLDAAIRVRLTDSGASRRVAYVVLAREVSLDTWRPPNAAAIDDVVPVAALPRTEQGEIDEDALGGLPVLDRALVGQARSALRTGGAARAMARIAPNLERPPRLHLFDLRPTLREGGADRGAAEAPNSQQVVDERPEPRRATMARPPALADGGPVEIPDDAPPTLRAALIHTADRYGDREIHYVDADGVVRQRYSELLADARLVLGGLHAAGLRAGDRVILQLDRLRDHYTAFWGSVLGGLVPTSVAVPSVFEQGNAAADKLVHAWRRLGCPVVLASRSLMAPLRALLQPAEGTIVCLDDVEGDAAVSVEALEPASPAFIQLSSGSTGASRCIPQTHRAIVQHVHALASHVGYGPDDVTLSWLPPDHVTELLMCHIKGVYLGCSQIHVRTERVLEEPLVLFDLVQAHRVTHTLSPNFGYRLLLDAMERSPDRRWDLSSIRRVANGAEQVMPTVTREFLRRTAAFGFDPRAMQPGFGMAEVASVVTFEDAFDPEVGVQHVHKHSLDGSIEFASTEGPGVVSFTRLGRPVPGVELRIVDDQARVLPEGVCGRLQIRGGVVMPGYLDDPEANAAAFVGEGWFDSGDLAFLLDGYLTLTGRAKDTIVVRGAKLYCHEVEEAVGTVAGVELAAACAVADPETGTEALLVCVVLRDAVSTAVALAAVRTRVTEGLGVAPLHVLPVRHSDIERTTSGKIRRSVLRRRFERGGFRAEIRRVDLAVGGARTVPAWFHRRTWRRSDAGRSSGRQGVTLVLGAPEEFVEGLRTRGYACVHVKPSKVHDPAGYERCVASAATRGPISAVIEATGWTNEAPHHSAAESILERVRLVRALASHGGEQVVRLQIVACRSQSLGADEPIHPRRALVAGMVETLAREQPGLDVRHLDLPLIAPDMAAAVVLDELRSPARERETAWRDGHRFVSGLAPVIPTPERESPFREGGVWLVTGGLGGVAFEVAKHLLSEHRARLLLIGRTLSGTERVARLEALRALAGQKGGDIRVASLDVSDESALRDAVGEIEAEWGTIDGVLHLAGVLDERSLAEEDLAHVEAILRAKVEGTAALEHLLDERPDAAFVAFSSTASVLGTFGGGVYAAGCRFAEAHAHARRLAGHASTWCVTWHRWEDTGMSRGRPFVGLPGAERLSPTRGVASLPIALHVHEDLVIGVDPAERDVRRRCGEAVPLQTLEIAGEPEPAPLVLHDRFGSQVPSTLVAMPSKAAASPALALRAAPRGRTEEAVASIWREILGREEIGARDNFFDLGGHSLLLAQVRVRLQQQFDREVPLLELFRHPTVAALAAWLSDEAEESLASAPVAPDEPGAQSVAIVGMSCRFPGASTLDALWENLCAGVESVRFFSDEELAASGVPPEVRGDPHYVPARAVLDDVAGFDAALFGLSPREAAMTDPQHRIFLECAWEALENAGCDPERFPGRIGVFAGAGLNGYLLHHLAAEPEALGALAGVTTVIGNDKDHLSTRVAYKLDLRGPAITVQSACSTSLVAVHLACEEILGGRCDAALAGGVSIGFPLRCGYVHQDGHILSPDGHCRAFASDAAGTVGGDGAGVVMLKRLDRALEDGDHVHAVLLGSAINNDGARKIGYTAPSQDGQAAVIAEAHARSGIAAADIGYIEAHGTGTTLGDAIEVAALSEVFGAEPGPKGACALGTVKSNFGHLNTAAGVAGLIKAALTVQHGRIPPTLHAQTPSPDIDPERGPFFVASVPTPWPLDEGPRRAGVSAFGFGGTNAHAVVQEPPSPPPRAPTLREARALVLSAHDETALGSATSALAEYLEGHPELGLADVGFTLQVGRRELSHRRAWVSDGTIDAAQVLRGAPAATGVVTGGGDPPVAMLFPGQGAQHPGMGSALYRTEPVFRAEVDRGCAVLQPILDADVRELLMPRPGEEQAAGATLTRTMMAQPALFVVEHALAMLWRSLGVRPRAVLGHSLGEFTAACVAGVFEFEEALALVCARGRLMESMRPGSMLVVQLHASALEPLLGPGVELAADNGPETCVAAGEPAAIDALERRLAARGVGTIRLRVAHAFHTAALDPILDDWAAEVERVSLAAPKIPLLSNITGTWMTDAEATDPGTWVRQARCPVRFSPAVVELLDDPRRLLLEVGPGRGLGTLALGHDNADGRVIDGLPPPTRAGASALVEAVTRLWVAGVPIDWSGAHGGEQPRRVPLPTYPFQRQRCWVEAPRARSTAAPARSPRWVATSWEPAPPSEADAVAGAWLVLGEPAAADAVRHALRDAGADCLPLAEQDPREPVGAEVLDELFDASQGESRTLAGIVFVGGEEFDRDVVSITAVLRALVRRCFRVPLRLVVTTRGAVRTQDDRANSARAALLGLLEAARAELPDLDARLVDVDGDRSTERARVVVLDALCSSREPVTAWREGRRLRPTTSVAPAASGPVPVGAQWLLVDGSAGIGLAAAEALAGAGMRVVLGPRPELPPRPRWEAVMQAGEAGDDEREEHRLDATELALRRALDVHPLESHPGLQALLDELCMSAVARFLTQSGVALTTGAEYDRDALRRELGIVSSLGRLFDALLDILVEDGIVASDGRHLRVLREGETLRAPDEVGREIERRFPRFRGIVSLVLHCTRSYPEALTGRTEAIGVLYPAGSASFVEQCDRHTAEYRSERRNILLLREAVRARVAGRRGPVRILEVGGGQGLLTWPLLSVLGDVEVHYHFTDLGKTFVDDARAEAAWRGLSEGFEADVLDLSRSASEQGFTEGSYDFVLAYNVLHAAPSIPYVLENLRTMLRPGGVLGVVEVVRTYRWDTLTWGLAEGWWHFEDELRQGSPLLDLDTWDRALEAAGYDRVLSFPRAAGARAADDHGLLWAQTRADAAGSERDVIRRMLELERRGSVLLDADATDAAAWRASLGNAGLTEPLGGVIVDSTALGPQEHGALLAVEPRAWPSLLTEASSRLDTIDEALGEHAGVRLVLGPAGASPSDAPLRRHAEAVDRVGEAPSWTSAMISSAALASGTRLASALRQVPTLTGLAVVLEPPATELSASPEPTTPSRAEASVHVAPATRHHRPALATAYVAPRNALEARVATVCAELLGVERVGVQDDFFDLGADSLIMLRLSEHLGEVLDRTIPREAVFRGATVERIALALSGEPDPKASPLVPIQPAGTRPPLFVAPPASGSTFVYIELAHALGDDQPLYALQALGLDGQAPVDVTVEDMARHYVDAIRTVQPHGPYHLAGFSFGALVAYEMAVQLAAAGEPPGLVALLDEPAPIDGYRPSLWLMARLIASGARSATVPILQDYLYLARQSKEEGGPRGLGARAVELVRRFVGRSAIASFVPEESRRLALRQPAMTALAELYLLHCRLTVTYEPRAYPHALTLFKATDISGARGRDITQGWRMLAAGGVDVHRAQGEHMTMLRHPNVTSLAARLSACLDAAQRDFEDS